MKICFRCKSEKDFSEFHKGAGTFGLHSWCKTCVSANRAQAYRDDPESRKRHALWTAYRLRPEDLDRLLREQLNSCRICTREFSAKLAMDVDHDHETGAVRGLLCHGCNIRLGWFEKHEKRVLDYRSTEVVD